MQYPVFGAWVVVELVIITVVILADDRHRPTVDVMLATLVRADRRSRDSSPGGHDADSDGGRAMTPICWFNFPQGFVLKYGSEDVPIRSNHVRLSTA